MIEIFALAVQGQLPSPETIEFSCTVRSEVRPLTATEYTSQRKRTWTARETFRFLNPEGRAKWHLTSGPRGDTWVFTLKMTSDPSDYSGEITLNDRTEWLANRQLLPNRIVIRLPAPAMFEDPPLEIDRLTGAVSWTAYEAELTPESESLQSQGDWYQEPFGSSDWRVRIETSGRCESIRSEDRRF